MQFEPEALMLAKAQMADRLDGFASMIGSARLPNLLSEIDDIRRTARDTGLDAVADLAYALEHAMSRASGLVTVQPYVDSMQAALGCEAADPALAQSFLAMVNSRLCG